MTELLFLLLPLAFYSGWQAARKRYRNRNKDKQKKSSTRFVKGINYLLNEEPDKALNFFLNHSDIDEYTAKTFLLLGNSFRNRGEVDRALKVHQNLIARPSLSKQQKEAAMLALGKDFFVAGLLDKAEAVFKELLENNPKKTAEACQSLREIYEQLQDWDKAIEVGKCAKPTANINQSKITTHYYCEMATQELVNGNLYLVQDYLQQAKKYDKSSSRIKIIQGDIVAHEGNYSKALKFYQAVVNEDPRLVGMLFAKMIAVSKESGGVEQVYHFLKQHFKKSKDMDVLEYLLELAHSHEQESGLYEILEAELAANKLSLQSILKSVKLLLKLSPSSEKNEELMLLEKALENHIEGQLNFKCQHCGYKMNEYLWRCPVCHYWDTIAKT